jgi:tRNA-modifying protein YgfZ
MDKSLNHFSMPDVWIHAFSLGACLHVTGEDALSFLQGQFTQELRSKAACPVAYGLWLNQKGKVLADSFVIEEANDNLLVVGLYGSAAMLRERLEAYIIADDVVIEDVTGAWKGVVVGGEKARGWLESVAGGVPAAGEYVRAGGGFLFRGRRGAADTWEWILPAGRELPAGADVVGVEAVESGRIAEGIPRVPQDIGVGDLPNEGGLDETGISYTKGCYLGQEVMARLKAMGTVRRRLVRVRASVGVMPAVPCALLQGEKRVGELRSVVADGAGGFIGLAMVTKLGLDPVLPLAPEPGGVGFIELVDQP